LYSDLDLPAVPMSRRADMNHDLFGELKYEDGYWLGEAKLPAFAAVSQRPPEADTFGEADAQKLMSDLSRTLEGLKSRMAAKYGDEFTKMIEAARAAEPPMDTYVPDSAAATSAPATAERSRQQAARIARGRFSVHIVDPAREGPTAQQEAAFRHLLAEADAIFRAVARQVFESYRDAYSQPHCRDMLGLKRAKSAGEIAGQYAVERVEIYREHRNGRSYLVFPLDITWLDEREQMVVYHPDRPAAWTLDEGLDELIRSDEPVDDE
jgi:hypothetical protein